MVDYSQQFLPAYGSTTCKLAMAVLSYYVKFNWCTNYRTSGNFLRYSNFIGGAFYEK